MEKITSLQLLGDYVIVDPEICHGNPTFRGTQIRVIDVLDQIAAGLAWETIIEAWRGRITKEAIAEAVKLVRQAFLKHGQEMALDFVETVKPRETADVTINPTLPEEPLDFFSLVGLWSDREVSLESIRQKAWPRQYP